MNLECAICKEQLFNGKKATAPLCGHVYHDHCIRYAIHKKPNCPLCQAQINRRSLVNLYFSGGIGVTVLASVTSSNLQNPVSNMPAAKKVASSAAKATKKAGTSKVKLTKPKSAAAKPAKLTAPKKPKASKPAAKKPATKKPAAKKPAYTAPVISSTSTSISFAPVVSGRITKRRATKKPEYFNYEERDCLICGKIFLSPNDVVLCDKCIQQSS